MHEGMQDKSGLLYVLGIFGKAYLFGRIDQMIASSAQAWTSSKGTWCVVLRNDNRSFIHDCGIYDSYVCGHDKPMPSLSTRVTSIYVV